MADSRSRTILEGEASDLYQEFSKIITKAKQYEGGIKKIGGEAKKAAREEMNLARAAKRVYDDTRTPQERHIQKMRQLNQLVSKGKIDQDTYGRAVRQSQEQLLRAGRAGDRAFGRQAQGQVASMIGTYASMAGTIALTTRALRNLDQAQEEIAAKQRESRMGLSSLGQLAETPEQMVRLVAAAKQTYREGGAESEDQAARMIFALESAGGMKYRQLFTELYASGLVEAPDVMARSAKTLLASMGQAETGTFRDLVSKAFGASKYSPVSAEQILEAAARTGTSARKLGMSDEAMLAATTMVATARGSADEAGTYMAQLMRSLYQKGEFQGMSFEEAIRQIASRQMAPQEVKKWFGRAQAMEAYDVIAANLGEGTEEAPGFARVLREVRASEAEDRVGKKLALPASIAQLKASRDVQRAEARREMAQTEYGIQRNRIKTAFANLQAEELEEGRSLAFSQLTGFLGWVIQQMPGVGGTEPVAARRSRMIHPSVAESLSEAASNFNAAAEELRAKARERPVQTTE